MQNIVKIMLIYSNLKDKMSSSSSYSSSSPPVSPKCNTVSSSSNPNTNLREFHRLNSDTILKTLKYKPHQIGATDTTNSNKIEDMTSWTLLDLDKTATNGNVLPSSSTSSSTATNDDSSKESLNNDFSQEIAAAAETDGNKLMDTGDDSSSSSLVAAAAKNADDIEATYMTSVSKNLITLRKTESLKLDSVQSIR